MSNPGSRNPKSLSESTIGESATTAVPPTEPTDGSGPTRTEKHPGFRSDIQGLRAIAVLLVVVFHSGFGLPGGFLGVDVFFVISGYVIGRLLISELSSSSSIRLSDFYSRRVRRILPALSVVLVFIAVASMVFVGPLSDLPDLVLKVGIASSTFSANAALDLFAKHGYFDLSSDSNPLLHMWTLAVEEQFYLFFPLLLLLVHRLVRRRRQQLSRWLVIVCAVVALASFIGGAYLATAKGFPLHDPASNQRLAFYASPIRAWEFLTGVLLVFIERSRFRLGTGTSRVLAAFGLAAILWSALTVTGESPTPGTIALVPVLGAAAIIVAGLRSPGGVNRLLGMRPMAYIGDRSYGWYLWHWPVIVFTRLSAPTVPPLVLLLVGIGALVPTELSYRIIERPIRFNRSWRGWRAVRLAALCCGIPILAFVGAFAVNRNVTTHLSLPGHPAQPHLDLVRACSGHLPTNPEVWKRCTWTVPNSSGRVVLIGDSLAGAMSEVTRDTALSAGYDFTLVTFNACRFADVVITTARSRCHRWVTAWTDYFAHHRESLIVTASRTSATIHLSNEALRNRRTGDRTNDEHTKAKIWTRGFSRTLSKITSNGNPVAVIATVPQFGDFETRLCPSWRLAIDKTGCSKTIPRTAVEQYRRVSMAAGQTATGRYLNAHLVDFTDDICGTTKCSTYRDGVFLYRDGHHLSVPGNRSLAPVVDTKVMALARPTR